jgi:hypothetical protein
VACAWGARMLKRPTQFQGKKYSNGKEGSILLKISENVENFCTSPRLLYIGSWRARVSSDSLRGFSAPGSAWLREMDLSRRVEVGGAFLAVEGYCRFSLRVPCCFDVGNASFLRTSLSGLWGWRSAAVASKSSSDSPVRGSLLGRERRGGLPSCFLFGAIFERLALWVA